VDRVFALAHRLALGLFLLLAALLAYHGAWWLGLPLLAVAARDHLWMQRAAARLPFVVELLGVVAASVRLQPPAGGGGAGRQCVLQTLFLLAQGAALAARVGRGEGAAANFKLLMVRGGWGGVVVVVVCVCEEMKGGGG
jgi:hypothetical protein